MTDKEQLLELHRAILDASRKHTTTNLKARLEKLERYEPDESHEGRPVCVESKHGYCLIRSEVLALIDSMLSE